MRETALTKPKRKTTTDYEAMVDQLLAVMRRLDELMQKDCAEIEYLEADTARLEAENRVVLSRLKAMWLAMLQKLIDFGKQFFSVMQKLQKQDTLQRFCWPVINAEIGATTARRMLD